MIYEEGYIIGPFVCDDIDMVTGSQDYGPGNLISFTRNAGERGYLLGRKGHDYFLALPTREKVADVGEYDDLGEALIAAARVLGALPDR